ncbi:MAG: energy-coupling factor transporter transmembrane protein EcfT [Clostridia bacterium]|nr:energy-coupling factor transporter transmembrane protein EcfT [Clostridia bacterium]
MKSIALGQYYPANSVIHRLDPRIKIILAVLYIVASFLCKNIISFAALAISAIVIILLGRIPLKIVLRGLRPIIIILVFTSFINIFWTKGEIALVEWKFINIYLEGIFSAIFIIIRITALIIGTSMFMTYTTTPIELTDALEDLLSPLKALHVPVHEFAMMMTIALRFIPTLVEETDRIMTAQKARGADFSSGGLVQRAKALIPILIPLFVSAFNRAGDLATAMECRCYSGGKGRTRMTVRHIRFVDFIPLILLIAFGAGLIVLNILSIGFTM